MKYEVGQIVYLLSNKELKIFPVQITEETIRRRIDGEAVTYKVALPTKSKNIVDLAELDARAFINPGDIRSHMIENTIKMIDGLLERAVKMGQTSFSNDELPVHEDEDMVE
jgi:hypothetical protein